MPEARERTALYRLYDVSGKLLYVGISNDPKRRFSSHRSTKAWWPEVDRRAVDWFDSLWLASVAERTAITTEAPRYNIRGTAAFRAQQSATARAISPEKRRARAVGCQARGIQVRTMRTLTAMGIPKEEAVRIALLARQRHKDASGLFPKTD